MRSLLNIAPLLLLLSSYTPTTATSKFTPSIFGYRGGGLFGGDKPKSDDAATSPSDTATDESSSSSSKTFPAMSKDEVEEWLGHIPVFAVTDSSGAGVVLKPDNETSVFYFFMSPVMANATLNQLKSANEELDLRVSAFSLGKIWFRILKGEGQGAEVKLKQPGGSEDDDEPAVSAKGVEYRLVPDTRDLLGARMLLTMDGTEGETLKAGGQLTPEMAQNAIRKAMTSSPKFNSTYNEIPVFMIQQMRIQKQVEEGSEDEAPVTLLPMYFSLQNMVTLWQQFAGQNEEAKGVEPAINLMDLFELVEKMQEDSEIDFRNVLLVPPTPAGMGPEGAAGGAAGMQQQAQEGGDPFKPPGDTLGDI